jgi:NAD(P)-dependent dehydrogenase (short-subunit alcohol dehydrogenase family)
LRRQRPPQQPTTRDLAYEAVWTPLNPADRQAEQVAKFGSATAMKRAAQPEEIAPAFVFMAAPSCSSYITGEILPIVGGYSGG